MAVQETKQKIKNDSIRRKNIQWGLAPLVIIVIALGWKYPLLGFTVPIVMLVGILGGIFNGRYVCGHLCPRGGFFDRMIKPISPSKQITNVLRSSLLRWILMILLMGFMVYRISLDAGNVYHWGKVFWLMCVITTAIGLVMALLLHQRGWCSICPVGTMANAFGGRKGQLLIDSEKCRECAVCEKACPMNLEIVKHKNSGFINEPDCLRCPECALVCPVNAISKPEKK
ncbi:MAG: 4Fe-4S binding protein [Armatimonadota bacterium]